MQLAPFYSSVVSDSTPDRMNSPIRASKCEPPGGLQRVHGHVNATVRRADDCARPNQTDQIFKWSRVPAQSMPPNPWHGPGCGHGQGPRCQDHKHVLHQQLTLLLLFVMLLRHGLCNLLAASWRRCSITGSAKSRSPPITCE